MSAVTSHLHVLSSRSITQALLLVGQSAESRTDGEDAVDLQGVVHLEAFPVVVHLRDNQPRKRDSKKRAPVRRERARDAP